MTMRATIPTGQEILVDGDADIDGKTFRFGIRGSHETRKHSGQDQIQIEIRPGSTRLIVGHYRFIQKELSVPGNLAARPAVQWVGTLSGYSVLDAAPDQIDDANSGPAQVIPPEK